MNQAQLSTHSEASTTWLDAAAFGLLLCDARLTVLQANTRCGEMLGVAPRELDGRHLFNVLELPERHCAQAMQALERRQDWHGLSRSGERALKVETRMAGNAAVASLIDYSADLEHLQRLTQEKTVAEKSSEAKSQFLQHMSHELRTPLNAIIGFTQLLKISENVDARERDNIGEIEKAGEKLLALINEILDLSKIEAGKLKLSEAHVDLRALAEECLQLVMPIAQPRGIGIHAHVAEGKLLLADYVRLKQILLNLLSNAVKYNHDGGSVAIHCLGAADHHLRIEIRDSGIGIEPQLLRTIFSPFERIGSIEGSGIGLMITRRLVALMQGRLGVFSLPERGSVFWVELPRKRMTLLESMLHDDSESAAFAEPRGPLFWIGARTPLFFALDQLRELRPALRLRHYDSLAAARDALQLEAPGLVLARPDVAVSAAFEDFTNLLKQVPCHVVTDNRGECRASLDASRWQSSQLYDKATLPVLLDLLDSYLTRP